MIDSGVVAAAQNDSLGGEPLLTRTLLRQLHEAARSGGWSAVALILDAVFRRYGDELRAAAERWMPQTLCSRWDPDGVIAEAKKRILRAVKAWNLPGEGSVLESLQLAVRRVIQEIASGAVPSPAPAAHPDRTPGAPVEQGAHAVAKCARKRRPRRGSGLL